MAGRLRLRPALRRYAHSVSVGGGGGLSLDADAQTLIAAMTTEPDSIRQTLISDTIVALKNAGIWTLLDECWFLAAHAEQAALLGWKRAHDCTAVNAPTFTVDEGFAGDGSTSYLNTNYTPSTDGVNYMLNDASLGVYSRTDGAMNWIEAGSRAAGPDNIMLSVRRSDNKMHWRINNGGVAESGANDSGVGLFVVRRTASNARQVLRNGSVLASDTLTSDSLSAQPIVLCAFNNNGTVDGFSKRQLAFAYVGASLSTDQQADLYTIVQDYMTSVGANV